METLKLPGYPDPIPIESILWLEGQAGYTRVHRKEKKALMVTQPLHTFEHYAGLVRIHRSTIINVRHAQKFEHQKGRSGWVELANRKLLPVSRAYLPVAAARLSHLTASKES
ncbi:LytTR family DNA-binding domain-containing protein [Spirosoma endophyticum]|uniref:LytTr DNA-binding domain-containing protein n=1 Tax=Spirosoma endophyticum TaxID=662367 RepID=A0A1I2I1R1_9BACT|nr:LytTR family DNA-binding domain-containing protein [Spirosoma endophyticum]SFF36315.1 LytTr DNA-binding domain-containing protein [Spirosoma endophyticum]